MAVLSLKNVSLHFGAAALLDEVELHVERGDRVCVLGVNGAGKSSLLKLFSGEYTPDDGEVARERGVRIGVLKQEVNTEGGLAEADVMAVVLEGVPHDDHEARAELLAHRMLDELGVNWEGKRFGDLSGGEHRRVLLVRALASEPDVIILDEPTNHLDVEAIEWLENRLRDSGVTAVFVTHDRAFLRRVATRIVELDRGRIVDWACDYDTFLQRKEDVLHDEQVAWTRMDKLLEKEEAWLRRGVKARTTRNEGRVRALEELRAERGDRREHAGRVRMEIQDAGRSGALVMKFANIEGRAGERLLWTGFSETIERGDRIGIIGANGCGKSTLLRKILVEGDGVRHGTNLQIAYADQLRDRLDNDASVRDSISEEEFIDINGAHRHVLGYLEDFLFSPDRARQKVGVLSGGERNRLLLAKLFALPSNLLILDEPTNDLDLDTLDILEDQIAFFNGTVLLVSHDRDFLNRTVSRIWSFESDADGAPRIVTYAGHYDDFRTARNRILAAEKEKQAARRAPESPAPTAPKNEKKLTWKEARRLEELPALIESLETEQAALHARFAEPDFYATEKSEMLAAQKRDPEITAALEALYAEWSALLEK